jgi:hypothetical protein
MLNGRDHYLGHFGSKESKDQYRRLIEEWEWCGRRVPTDGASLSMNRVMLAYLRSAAGYYNSASETSEVERIKEALSPLKELYGTLPAGGFGPKKLKRLRETMLAKGWCRTNVNHQIHRAKRMIKWAVSEELLSQSM